MVEVSADVHVVYVYHAYCPDCATGSESDENEDRAIEWADEHNAECHETDNSNDEDYERFKEARYGD